jgi:hypothetical protein
MVVFPTFFVTLQVWFTDTVIKRKNKRKEEKECLNIEQDKAEKWFNNECKDI